MWGELLNSDLSDNDLSTHFNDHEVGVSSLYNAENGIESWAAENLPSSQTEENLPLHHESTSTEDSSIESQGNASKFLCYGMVSDPHSRLLIMSKSLFLGNNSHLTYRSTASWCKLLGI